MRSKNVYDANFKSKLVLLSIREEKTILEIALEYGIDPKIVRDWKKRLCRLKGNKFKIVCFDKWVHYSF